ncbi:MAG: 30S ribosomal protein S18 [Patescibacteria group bacterium]
MRRNADYFTRNQVKEIDYRDGELLSRYLTNWGKLKPARETGLSARHQRQLSRAVKNARFLGLLPFNKR